MGNQCCYTKRDRTLDEEKLDIVLELSKKAYKNIRKPNVNDLKFLETNLSPNKDTDQKISAIKKSCSHSNCLNSCKTQSQAKDVNSILYGDSLRSSLAEQETRLKTARTCIKPSSFKFDSKRL